MRFRKRYINNILLICFSTIIVLLLGEVILHFALPSADNGGYYIWPPKLRKVFKPNPDFMPGVSDKSEFIINSQGMRGDELSPSHTYRILAIGGSTTECLYLDQSETWPHLLQKSVNEHVQNQFVWVGNGGMSARYTRHHLIAMRYLPLRGVRIDAVIMLIGINDFLIRLSQDKQYDPNFMDKTLAEEKLVARTFMGNNPNTDKPLYEKSAIWRLLQNSKHRLLTKQVQDRTGKIYNTWRQYRHNASEIRDELPDLLSALEEYSRNINNIIDIAEEKSVRLIFLTQPTIWKPGLSADLEVLLWTGGIGNYQNASGSPYYSIDALVKGMKVYNDTLLQICQERNVECIDLASVLAKDTTIFYDDVHFNEGGARKVAAILSEYIVNQGPFREIHDDE
ncbi:MAG: hypothetical protein GY777_26790 [Candidatus Brocadiaceae bacterium]|nr:hypothetical protein [Candidatus Brocadiaceae bacterium]